jgi:hypothetical protein
MRLQNITQLLILWAWPLLLTTGVPGPARPSSASLSGTVLDVIGRVMELTLTDAGSGAVATFTTDDEERYSFQNLAPGTYEMPPGLPGSGNIARAGSNWQSTRKPGSISLFRQAIWRGFPHLPTHFGPFSSPNAATPY